MCARGKLRRKMHTQKMAALTNNGPLCYHQHPADTTGTDPARHMSYHSFCKTMRNHCQHVSIIHPLYAHQDSIEEVLKKRTVRKQTQYMVKWTANNMLRQHIPLLKDSGYHIDKVQKCSEVGKMFGPTAGRLTALVTLKPKYEPDDGNNIPGHLIDDFETKRAGLGHLKFTSMTRKDEHKSNTDRQGYWISLESETKPHLP